RGQLQRPYRRLPGRQLDGDVRALRDFARARVEPPHDADRVPRRHGGVLPCADAHQHRAHRLLPRRVGLHLAGILPPEGGEGRSRLLHHAAQGEPHRLRERRGEPGHRQRALGPPGREAPRVPLAARSHRLHRHPQRGHRGGPHAHRVAGRAARALAPRRGHRAARPRSRCQLGGARRGDPDGDAPARRGAALREAQGADPRRTCVARRHAGLHREARPARGRKAAPCRPDARRLHRQRGGAGAHGGREAPQGARRTKAADPLLGGLSPAAFLRRHWQKRPHLVRGAMPDIAPFLTRDELFDLASREGVESRLVLEKGGDYPWQVRYGPFRPAELRRLPPRNWTILVQNGDLHVPKAAAILRRFSFVPGWRIDDLMVSYAPPGGGVGPHVDSYDVFLLQARGTRRWSVSLKAYGEADLVPGLDLRILKTFRTDHRWRLATGDMLYLPPGVAHWGVAEDECMTCSVGFRAPGSREAALRFLEEGGTDVPYSDPDLEVARHPGEITAAARRRIRRLDRKSTR